MMATNKITTIEEYPVANKSIQIIRSIYSTELRAYYLRSAKDTFVFVNSNQTNDEQERCINLIKTTLHGSITQYGIIKKDFSLACEIECIKELI